jgi:hypothetical protein
LRRFSLGKLQVADNFTWRSSWARPVQPCQKALQKSHETLLFRVDIVQKEAKLHIKKNIILSEKFIFLTNDNFRDLEEHP